MTARLLALIASVLLGGCAALPPGATTAAPSACTAASLRASGDARIRLAVDQARRQHQLFGGQTIERNGGLFRVGYHEAAWSRPAGESTAAWQRVAEFWRALAVPESVGLNTSVGRVALQDLAPPAVEGHEATAVATATHEALLRAAMMDTPWSAAFISYLMKAAGFAGAEFAFSDSHSDYVQAALDTSAAEAAGQPATHAFRACDVATTRPRPGDLLCATRAGTAGTVTFDALAPAMAQRRVTGRAFPMHCDLVVRADEGGDGGLDAIGGNVVNSVTLVRMTLDARKVLSRAYFRAGEASDACEEPGEPCSAHLGRRPWVVLLQFRH